MAQNSGVSEGSVPVLTAVHIVALKASFGWLFPGPDDIRAVSAEAGLHPEPFTEKTKPDVVWEGVLQQASRRGSSSVRKLLQAALRRYPEDTGLNAFVTLLDFIDQYGAQAIHTGVLPQAALAEQTGAPASTPPDAATLAEGQKTGVQLPREGQKAGAQVPREVPSPAPVSKPAHPDMSPTRPAAQLQVRKLKLFYCYTDKDEAYREELEGHLETLAAEGLLDTWHHRVIDTAGGWKKKVSHHLEEADVVLFLVNQTFLASGYLADDEASWALKMHERGQARVVPVILSACEWNTGPLAKVKAIPEGAPIGVRMDRGERWLEVVQGLRKVADERRYR